MRSILLLACLLLAGLASPGPAGGKSHYVERDGQRIHMWEKLPESWKAKSAGARRVAVFVHGATWSGRPDFDLQIRDYSVMDHFVQAGWGAYAIDMQGYGASDDPVGDNWCEAKDAALDIAAAVEWICAATGVEEVHLLGWSWGCQTAGLYAEAHPERVAKLVMQGGHYETKYDGPAPEQRFRTNDAEGAASDFIDGCYEQDVVDLYVKECLRHDAATPNGVMRDFLVTREPLLTPAKLSMPVLMILGEHEASPERLADLGKYFAGLESRHKQLMVLPGGGHAILLEKPRVRWQNLVRRFFEEDWN